MQVDQRDALDDPRPVVGIMAHAYANPLISSNSSNNNGHPDKTPDAGNAGTPSIAQDLAAAAANELVIDALLAAEAETIGLDVRFLGFPRGTHFPPKKPAGGAWRGADGLRVVDSALPKGLVKKGWLHKHTRELPAALVYLASVDVSAGTEDWAKSEDEIVLDLRGVVAGLAARDVKVGEGIGRGGGLVREMDGLACLPCLLLRSLTPLFISCPS